jgi:hypothetical protein
MADYLICPACSASEEDDHNVLDVRDGGRCWIVCTNCGYEAGGLTDSGYVMNLFARTLTAEKLRELSEGSIAGAQAENRLRVVCAEFEAMCDSLDQPNQGPHAEVVIRHLRSAIAAARPATVENLRENAPGCTPAQGSGIRENSALDTCERCQVRAADPCFSTPGHPRCGKCER